MVKYIHVHVQNLGRKVFNELHAPKYNFVLCCSFISLSGFEINREILFQKLLNKKREKLMDKKENTWLLSQQSPGLSKFNSTLYGVLPFSSILPIPNHFISFFPPPPPHTMHAQTVCTENGCMCVFSVCVYLSANLLCFVCVCVKCMRVCQTKPNVYCCEQSGACQACGLR